jgi:hypothetical protein
VSLQPYEQMREPVRRVAAVGLTALFLTALACGPAYADDPVGKLEGADPGTPPDTLTMLLLYVALPVAVVSLIAMVVWLPGAMKANRYRPNRPWTATPVWFAGPDNAVDAVRSAQLGDVVRGGARGEW